MSMTPKVADVLIIGGGVAGLTCAMTLASAHRKPWFGNRRVLVIDDGRSDLNKALLNNAPGIEPGAFGTDILARMKNQFVQYQVGCIENATIISAHRLSDDWSVQSDHSQIWHGRTLVLATGYKRWNIDGLPCTPTPHPRGGKSDRIMIEHDGCYLIDDSLYVAGLLAGGSSQFAIAAGIGAQVAVDILSDWSGRRTHIHDVPDTP